MNFEKYDTNIEQLIHTQSNPHLSNDWQIWPTLQICRLSTLLTCNITRNIPVRRYITQTLQTNATDMALTSNSCVQCFIPLFISGILCHYFSIIMIAIQRTRTSTQLLVQYTKKLQLKYPLYLHHQLQYINHCLLSTISKFLYFICSFRN